jgi:hypothetical protein
MSTIDVDKKQLQEIINQLDYVSGALDSIFFNFGIDENNDDFGYLQAEVVLIDSTTKLKKLIDRMVN